MRTRIIAVLLVALMVISGSGISQAQDAVSLRLAGWASSPSEDAALQKMLDAFMAANPNIKVEFTPTPEYPTTMQTAFASGDYADVFYVDGYIFQTWAQAGVIADGTDKIVEKDDIYESLRNVFTIDGKLYCAPKDFSLLALEYNKDLFDAAGLEYPTADWTWDDLKAAATALTTEKDGQKVAGLILPADLNRWLPFVYQAGGALFDAEGKYAMNSPEAQKALDFFLGMVEEGIATSASTVDSGWGGEALGKGRGAMVMEGNWVIQYMLDNYPDVNWGVAPMPASPEGGKATMVYTVCYGVNPSSKNVDAAWTLANFLTGPEGAKMVAESGFGVLPGRASAGEAWTNTWNTKLTDLKKETLAADLGAFLAGAAYARPWQLPAGWNAFNDAFNASLQEAFAGNKLPEDVLADASAVAEELASK